MGRAIIPDMPIDRPLADAAPLLTTIPGRPASGPTRHPDGTGVDPARHRDRRPDAQIGGPRHALPPGVHASEPEPDVTEFPIQPSKVQRPTLRESTLRRDRLLDWLHAKIHHRVVFVTAEAGYGKTTLLADFARRTRLRTLWYRLDEEDADWISVVNYLVAAGRVLDPGFAPTTHQMLREVGTGGTSRDAIVETFVHELAVFGDAGTVLILDDYHLVDHAPDVRALMREIVTRAPERLTVVIASRRRPAIPVARLRALGELVELRTAELRFDEDETDRLFRESYGTPLEADVLADLSRRTEGWAASLQLVQAAIRDRSRAEVRAFVRGLTGAQAELHDYLAEEVVGDLDPGLQSFLMSTSVLQFLDPDLGAVAAGVDRDRAVDLTEAAVGLGLLSDTSAGDGARYHPLVRDFLEARLRREIGPGGMIELHHRIARAAEGRGWRIAAHHYLAAGDLEAVHRVVASSTRAILGGGEFAQAESYIEAVASLAPDPAFDMIRSRMELHRDHVPLALERARAAAAAFPPDSADPHAHMALANLMSVEFYAGNLDDVLMRARSLASQVRDSTLAAISDATVEMLLASTNGDLRQFENRLVRMRTEQAQQSDFYYLGITQLNLAGLAKARGDAAETLKRADDAIDALRKSAGGHEIPSALLLRAWALAHTYRWAEAEDSLTEALQAPHDLSRVESVTEAADIHDWYGSPLKAEALLALPTPTSSEARNVWAVSRAQNLLSLGRYVDAASILAIADPEALTREVAHKSRYLFVRALFTRLQGSPMAPSAASHALEHARRQNAGFWERLALVLVAADAGTAEWSSTVGLVLSDDRPRINLLADVVVRRLGDLSADVRALLDEETRSRPDRWRPALRLAVLSHDSPSRLSAAQLLDDIGAAEDVALLRRASRQLRTPTTARPLGNQLARRLAQRVVVEDQGRVSIRIGETVLPGTAIRRKVLALLCFLLTKPDLSATRDQVLDALWPDVEPDIGANSLNQTVYFLRRVFEPTYQDETTPEYVHHDSDLLWLDQELVDSRSRRCRRLIRDAGRAPGQGMVQEIAEQYLGQFALDFAYEEWAAAYRNELHAAYLEVIESAIAADTNAGDFSRAILLARRAVEVDPEAEHLELSLLRLYRLQGAHAAAAEQYAHYIGSQQDELGSEAAPTGEAG